MTIYLLKSDVHHYSFFQEKRNNDFKKFDMEYHNWQLIENFREYSFELIANDFGKKNYFFDISVANNNYCIFSEKAIDILRPMVRDCGEFFPIQTPSKRKKFMAFYPYKNIYPHSVINLDKSDIGYYANGHYQIYHPVFNLSINQNDPLFVVDGLEFNIFVNDEFKQLVEQHDLKGFDFSEIIPIMD